MNSTAAASRMVDAFTSVGAESFVVTKTDLHQSLIWGRTYRAEDLHRLLPAMVRTAAIRKPCKLPNGETILAGENLIIRPKGKNAAFVQLDDVTAEQLERLPPRRVYPSRHQPRQLPGLDRRLRHTGGRGRL